MLSLMWDAFGQIVFSYNILVLFIAVFIGMILGAIPGLTATMAMAFVIPMTFHMDPVTSLIMLMAAYKGSLFGGSIPAVLFAAPGTPAAAFTVADGYQLAKQGKGTKALKVALVSSVSGDMFSDIILVMVAVPLSKLALRIGPPEFTMIVVFSMTLIGVASGESALKGLLAAFLGLLLSSVGQDYMVGTPRFAFKNYNLYGGFELMSMLIGLLAFSEILTVAEKKVQKKDWIHLVPPKTKEDSQLSLKEFKKIGPTILRSSVVGTVIGVLPGLGPTLAALLGYNIEKRFSKVQHEFGRGNINGIAAAEAANNAVSGANLIPLLTLGVPGDITAAVLAGAFLIQGIRPGPLIFREQPTVIYAVYAGIILANIALLIVAFPLLKVLVRMVRVPVAHLFPVIIVLCTLGAFAIDQNWFNASVMLVFGIIGYLMKKLRIPTAPLLIGFILGPMFEMSIRRSLIISGGSLLIFVQKPIAIVFACLSLLSITFYLWKGR